MSQRDGILNSSSKYVRFIHPHLTLRGAAPREIEAQLQRTVSFNKAMENSTHVLSARNQCRRGPFAVDGVGGPRVAGAPLNDGRMSKDPFNQLPAAVMVGVMKALLHVPDDVIHCLSRLDPTQAPENVPAGRKHASGLPKRFHWGRRAECNITYAKRPQEVLAVLSVCKRACWFGIHVFYGTNVFAFSSLGEFTRFARGVGRARLQRVQNVEMVWMGNLQAANTPSPCLRRSENAEVGLRPDFGTSKRSEGLSHLLEMVRLKTLVVHVNEGEYGYMRRRYENCDDVHYLAYHSALEHDMRFNRNLHTLQGLDYLKNLRGLEWIRFYDLWAVIDAVDRDKRWRERVPIRDQTFQDFVAGQVTGRPKDQGRELAGNFENLVHIFSGDGGGTWVPRGPQQDVWNADGKRVQMSDTEYVFKDIFENGARGVDDMLLGRDSSDDESDGEDGSCESGDSDNDDDEDEDDDDDDDGDSSHQDSDDGDEEEEVIMNSDENMDEMDGVPSAGREDDHTMNLSGLDRFDDENDDDEGSNNGDRNTSDKDDGERISPESDSDSLFVSSRPIRRSPPDGRCGPNNDDLGSRGAAADNEAAEFEEEEEEEEENAADAADRAPPGVATRQQNVAAAWNWSDLNNNSNDSESSLVFSGGLESDAGHLPMPGPPNNDGSSQGDSPSWPPSASSLSSPPPTVRARLQGSTPEDSVVDFIPGRLSSPTPPPPLPAPAAPPAHALPSQPHHADSHNIVSNQLQPRRVYGGFEIDSPTPSEARIGSSPRRMPCPSRGNEGEEEHADDDDDDDDNDDKEVKEETSSPFFAGSLPASRSTTRERSGTKFPFGQGDHLSGSHGVAAAASVSHRGPRSTSSAASPSTVKMTGGYVERSPASRRMTPTPVALHSGRSQSSSSVSAGFAPRRDGNTTAAAAATRRNTLTIDLTGESDDDGDEDGIPASSSRYFAGSNCYKRLPPPAGSGDGPSKRRRI